MELARLTLTPTTVSECEIVKYEQLIRSKDDVDLHLLDVQAVSLEERTFCPQGVELVSTEKGGLGLYAWEQRRAWACGVDDAGEAPLRITHAVIPGPMGPTVSDKSGR